MLPRPLDQYQNDLIQIAKDNDISYLAYFGSYARGEQREDSDLDLLISFDKEKGLLDLIDIQEKMSNLVGVKIDLITKKGLNKYIKPYIQDDIKLIYAKKS